MNKVAHVVVLPFIESEELVLLAKVFAHVLWHYFEEGGLEAHEAKDHQLVDAVQLRSLQLLNTL